MSRFLNLKNNINCGLRIADCVLMQMLIGIRQLRNLITSQLLFSSIIYLASSIMVSSVWSGDFHQSGTMLCSDCHTMHYSEGGQPAKTPSGEAYPGPSQYLIRAESINLLCLSCHDGGTGGNDTAPDVTGVASYESTSLKRNAGAFQSAVGVSSNKGHNLSVTNSTAPGSNPIVTFAQGLTCVSCHDAHGNENYRNLQSSVGNSTSLRITYQNGTYSGNSAVYQIAVNPTSIHYSTGNIQYRYDNTADGLSQWCKGCHTNFHGSGGDSNLGGTASGDNNATNSEWLRHPTIDVTMAEGVTNQHIDTYGWFTTFNSRLKVVSPSNQIPGTSGSSDNQVACITCHKAHGSNNKYAVIFDNPTTTDLEDGTSMYESCQQCHNK